MLTGFVTVAVLMLAAHQPQGRGAKAARDRPPPGNVMVEANWPPGMDSDVDLWVQAPGDVPVGYSNKGGAVFNLLRDDLGQQLDLSGLNYESSYSRGVRARRVHGQPASLPQPRRAASGAGDRDRQHQDHAAGIRPGRS